MAEHFQLLVIGAGPGGYIAALKAAQMGARVAVVEKHHLGGTCLNYGCIPSKALLSSAEMLHSVKQADKWGVKVGGEVGFDWAAITGHKDRVIRQLRGGIASLLKGRAVTNLAGKARFDAPGRVVITAADGNDQLVTADKVIIATGSVPMRIPGWPDDPSLVCTSDEAVHWKDLPKRLLIVGGGVIGCEFACMMQSFGVAVTIVELMPRILPTLDARSRQRVAESVSGPRHRLPSGYESRRDGYCRNEYSSADLDGRIAGVRSRARSHRSTAEHWRTGAGSCRYSRRSAWICWRKRATRDECRRALHNRRCQRPQHAGARRIRAGSGGSGECVWSREAV